MHTTRNTVIFDLDGTLLNTLTDLTSSVNHVMSLHKFPRHSQEAVRQMVGNGIYVLFEKALPGGRQNPAYECCLKEFQRYYAAHMQEETAPFPGVLALLEQLSEEGYALAVVSNKFDAAVKALCQDYFAPYIETAIGESPAIARKPAPDTVFAAMKQLNVTREQCIYVGDSEVDLATARNAGIPCISVDWGFKSRAFLLEHKAAVIVSDTEALLRCIHDGGPAINTAP